MIAPIAGGPDVITREDFILTEPGEGEVLVAHEAIGLNFIDTYFRSGLYPADPPILLGNEAAGTVIAIGPGVDLVSVGARVAYAWNKPGSYSSHRIIPAERLVLLPDEVSAETAAAAMLKGMTAGALIEDCARMEAGQVALVHAAAGGVGSFLVAWLADMGVTVIAHSGSAEKAERAKAYGATHSLSCPMEEIANAVRELTYGRGVDVVFDGVGKSSWTASLLSLQKRGLLVSYGNASGVVPAFSLLDLSRNGSLFVTRPTLFDYIPDRAALLRRGERIFDRLARNVIRANVQQRFALADAAEAHRALESRQTIGSSILLP